MEQFEEPVAAVVDDVKNGGDQSGDDKEPNDLVTDLVVGDDTEKVDKFNPKDHKWTVTNRKSKNLPQLFRDFCGKNYQHEVKKASEFGEGQADQVSAALDSYCKNLTENPTCHTYQQVIFKD